MVEYQQTTLDRTFSALGDPTRRAIVARLQGGSLSISALAQPFRISLQAVMKHLDVLAQAGLVTRTKTGRSVTVSLLNEPIDAAAAWLAEHQREWNASRNAK
jgi:DNA-binding transcriptional ArsR family regulator